MLQESTAVEFVLMSLAGGGLLGCFAATFGIDFSGRGHRSSRRLSRPRSSVLGRETAA